MDEQDKKSGKRDNGMKGIPVAFVVVAVAILIAVSIVYFSFLDEQLFRERSNHIVEFTDKASEIVDGVIAYSWQQVLVCENVIRTEGIASEEEMLTVLTSTSDFINEQNSIVLAIDRSGKYYSSDENIGCFQQTELLAAQAGEKQMFVSEIPHNTESSYFIFLKRLERPIFFGTDSGEITHLVLAVDIEEMREKIAVNGFGDQCYTYLVNKDGTRLYKHTYANHFIEGQNILHAFEDYKIVHGGSYEEFKYALEQGYNTVLEFAYTEEDGKEQKCFVASAAVATQNWQILLFVPSDVLGASARVLLHETI